MSSFFLIMALIAFVVVCMLIEAAILREASAYTNAAGSSMQSLTAAPAEAKKEPAEKAAKEPLSPAGQKASNSDAS